ncbi:MAG: sporulation protein [Acidobacteriaceae bacterium]|nr:sporulation protein [Acidobacteriaceae bacterium]
MQLWTDYEGRTIAEAYPLEKLISPEGRSAFFSTSNGTGTPAVIRIIETHFDESEILSRWQRVADLKQPNLITLRKFGQDKLDGTPLVYAVMEPSDANLADVLKGRALTPAETRDIATSLVAALQSLHSQNLVHEHIEPVNILAVGETIKLRSDCVRELPTGEDAANESIALKARDVHDLSVVLLQALTLRHTMPGTPLPAPFDAIIRNGISGAWSLDKIATTLTPPAPPAAPVVPKPVTPPVSTAAATPTTSPTANLKSESTPSAAPVAAAAAVAAIKTPPVHTTPPSVRDRLIQPDEPEKPQHRGLWIAGALVLLLVLILLWRNVHSTPATVAAPTTTAKSATSPTATAKPSAIAKPSAASTDRSTSRAARSAATPAITTGTPGEAKTLWRVVSYTYNREDQAQQKVDSIASQHSDLHPEVFRASGHSPYLVTLGGPMTHDQAAALRNQARNAGLPHDTYIQNYSR